MNRKRLLKTALGLLLAFSMAFAPMLSSYSVTAFAEGTDQEVAAGSAEVTGQGSEDPGMADTAPAEETAPADPAKGSGDTNADTPKQEEPAAEPASGDGQNDQGDQGGDVTGGDPADEEADDPTEDEVVDNDLFVSVQPLRDDDEVAIDTAETGEKLTARFYAFNDNPNATAIAKIRVYADQITRKTDRTAVKHDDEDKVELKGAVGDKATTIVAEWKTLKADDPENDRGYAVDYLEFELPAGASVDCDIDLATETGYDAEIQAEVYAEYKIADNNGEYPKDWSKPEDEEENTVLLTWTGEFKWNNFLKSASPLTVGYGGGKFNKYYVEYRFSADNKMHNAQTGVVYTDNIILEDTITLPEMLSLPEGANVKGDKILNSAGKWVYYIYGNGIDYTVDELEIKSDHSIYFRMTIKNDKLSDPASASTFAPMNKIHLYLYLNTLSVSDAEQLTDPGADPVKIVNNASFEANSVEANDGDEKEIYTDKYDSDAIVTITPEGEVVMRKDIIKVEDTSGYSVQKVGGEWQVKRNYKVTYQITIDNISDFEKNVKGLTDVVPKGLTIIQSSFQFRIGYNSAAASYGWKNNPVTGAWEIEINNFRIPAHKTGTITYTVTVDEKDYTPDTCPTAELPLKNLASFEGTTVEVPVRRMPEVKYTIKKAVVARFTKSLTGNNCVIYGEWDPRTEKYTKVQISGDAGSLYSSVPGSIQTYAVNPSDDSDIVKALHEFDGGDTIIYNIYFLNEGDTDFDGSVTDYSPFDGNPARKWSAEGDKYKYQALGDSYYYQSSRRYAGDIYPTWGPPSSVVGGSDFSKSCEQIQSRDGGTATMWQFSRNKPLKAGDDYVQSTMLEIPGNQNGPILSSNDNSYFEMMASGHACNTVNSSSQPSHYGNCAMIGTSSQNSSVIWSNYLYHHVAGQASIDTGVAATPTVKDINNVQYEKLKTYYYEQWDDYPQSDFHTFQAMKNQTIVNYVYVYNDSCHEMDLSSVYDINIYLPYGFKYQGLAEVGSPSGDTEGGGYFYFTPKGNTAYTARDYYSWIIGATHRPNGPSFYWDSFSTSYEMFKYGPRPDNYNDYSLSASPSSDGRSVRVNTQGYKLRPYTGMRFYYYASVDDPSYVKRYTQSSPAQFIATLQKKSGYIPRLSPTVRVRENFSTSTGTVWGNRVAKNLDNHGEVTSYETPSGTWVDSSSIGPSASPTCMKAGVALYEKTVDSHKISVRKEVIKNSGEDSVDQYRNGNIYSKVSDLTTSYDDYQWYYPLHDGIHRTVDGTVTWKMTVTNQAEDNDGYKPFSYGILSDTIDSPYELAEINVPELLFSDDSGSSRKTVDNVIFKLPVGDEGWDNVSEGISVYTYDTATGQKAETSDSGSFTAPRIRVTRKFVDNGAVAWGYDTSEAGDHNVDAYRYIIEISDYADGDTVYKPILNSGESVNFYMTFATTDAIETNYNSFSLVLPGVDKRGIDIQNNAKLTTISGTHNGQGTVAGGASAGRSDKQLAKEVAQSSAGKMAGMRLLAASAATGFATGGSYATEASNPDTPAVEYSDWTDTSYTDALKTITGPDGESINSREDGNMVLPSNVKAGDIIHTQLAVESVIYESEHYSHFDDLVIYDLYGASTRSGTPFTGSQPGKSSYDVLFDTIKVTDSLGRTYELGTDYDILYTNADLVYKEHHPITPVNTLTYAADLEMLEAESTVWEPYVAGSSVAPKDAHAFKIVLKNGKDAVYNDRDDIGMDVEIPEGALTGKCFIYVDFDAKVPEGLSYSYSYPNIEAYSAKMNVIGSDEVKPFVEDTTAVQYRTGTPPNIKIKKTTEVEEGLTAPEQSSFKYLLIRANSNSYFVPSLKKEQIEAIAELNLEPDTEYDISKGKNLELIYKDNKAVFNKADFFFNNDSYYYLLEIDPGEYTYKTTTGRTSGSYSSSRIQTKSVDLAGLKTSDPYVNEKLSEIAGESFNLFVFYKTYYSSEYSINIDITSVNAYAKRELKIEKVDEYGHTIWNPVKFELRDKDNNLVKFYKDGVIYTADENGDVTEIEVIGTAARVQNLDPGKYTLIETEAPHGYKIPGDGVTQIDTSKGTAGQPLTVTVKDPEDEEVQTGELTINKIDSVTKEVITDDWATFEIYNRGYGNPEPLTFIKNADGEYTYAAESTGEYYTELETVGGILKAKGLPFGTYYVVETRAPAGYMLAGNTLSTARSLAISRGNAFVVAEIDNKPISGSVNIVKADADDEKPIVGSQATFNIQSEDGAVLKFREKTEGTDGAYKYDAEGEITDLKTNKSTGKLEVTGLPQGDYKAVEIKAPVGYKVNSEGTSFEIKDNSLQTVTVSDETAEAALKLVKKWRLEGGRKARPLADVEFTLYKLDEETKTAESIGTKTTDENGELKFEGLDWKATYYISEKVPAGYTPGAAASKAYVDANGAIDFNVTEPTDGYTEIDVLKINMKDGLEEIDNEFVYTEDVLNIKNLVYGGMYGSVSYKTIDNKKAAAEYEGLEERTGYGFYYTDQDYAEGNYNYVDAVNPGDIVTYTLNVSNVSDYDFGRFAIIDRLPETGDTGVVNLKEKRDSEFTVSNNDGEFKVEVDGKVVDPSMYEVSFSDKVEFTNGDFNGTTTWDGTYADAKSVRIAFTDDFILETGQTVVVTFDGKISDEAKPDQFAWNDFAYRYTAITEEEPASKAARSGDEDKVVTKSAKANGKAKDVVITPEPPKVGVHIVEGKAVIGGEKKYECSESTRKDTETFTFTLTRSDDLEYGVTYKDKNGKLAEFPDEGLTVNVKATLNGKAVKFEFPELHFSHTGKYEFDVRENAGSNTDVVYDPAEYHVVVDGTDIAEYTSEDGITPVYTLDGEEAATASFTNTKKAFGDLEVSKKAKNAGKADKNTEFSFNIELTTVTGDPYEDEVSYTKGSEKGTLTPEDGIITIKLKAGEKAVFKDLPAGVK